MDLNRFLSLLVYFLSKHLNIIITFQLSRLVFTCALIRIFVFQLIPMMDIKEVIQDFQKLNKTENCIVIHMKNEQRVAVTSPVSMTV